jgi:hypothetical protein
MSLEPDLKTPVSEPQNGFSIRYLLERLVEIGVSLAGFAIAGLTLWACYYIMANREEVHTPLLTILAITYAMAFVAMALLLFSTRLLIPSSRLPGGRIIGTRGLWAFGILYGLMLLLALAQGLVEAKRGALALLLGVAVAVAWGSTFKSRS